MKKPYLLVLGIVFCVLFAAGVVLMVYMNANTTLLGTTELTTGDQNNVMEYDDANDIFFIGTRTGAIIAFDNRTHEVLWRYQNDAKSPLTSLVAHGAAGLVYAGSDDQNVYTIDIASGEVLDTLNVQRRVTDIDVTADGTLVAMTTITNNKTNILVYDLASGAQLANTSYSYPFRFIMFAPDDASLLLANERGQVLHTTFDCEEIANANVLQTRVVGFAKNNVGQYLATDIRGNYIVVDADMNLLRHGSADAIEGAIFSAGGIDDNGNVILGTQQGFMYVMNANDKQIYTGRQAEGRQLSDFAPDGDLMYITGYGDFVDYIELARLETIATLNSLSTLITAATICFAVLGLAFLLLYFPATKRLLFKIGKTLWKHKGSYIALIPCFTLLVLFNYTPMVIALSRAFTNWNANGHFTAADIDFVGFDNFKRMLTDEYLTVGIKNMIILALSGFVKTFTMPLIAAWLVYSFRSGKQKYAYRFLFVLPIVVPGIVGTLMWTQIYNPGGGLDQLLTALGLERWIHVWLGERQTALWAVVFMGIPYIGAFPFLMYYGGFTAIDANLYEAAKIDGANRWKIFWRIQLPMVMPQIKLLIMLQFIGCIQDYGGIYLLTGGGPGNSTFVPGLQLYYSATRYGTYGYACAIGLTMFVLIMIGTFFNNKIKAENYNS